VGSNPTPSAPPVKPLEPFPKRVSGHPSSFASCFFLLRGFAFEGMFLALVGTDCQNTNQQNETQSLCGAV